MKIIKKGPTLKGSELQKRSEPAILGSGPNEFLIKGLSLTNIQSSGPNRNSLKGLSLKVLSSKRTDPVEFIEFMVFSPSSKLSPGLSNQPKSPIYLFRQSQCQIANLTLLP